MAFAAEAHKGLWSETYRGYHLATLRGHQCWHVVFDHVVQNGRDFETAEEASAWLRRRADARVAEAIYPGLARELEPSSMPPSETTSTATIDLEIGP